MQNITLNGFPAWAEIFLAIALDLLLGDPHWFPHPVRLIGKGIEILETFLRRWTVNHPGTDRVSDERRTGLILCIVIVVFSMFFAWLLPFVVGKFFGDMWESIVRILIIYFAIAARSLSSAGRKVSKALEQNDLPKARNALRSLVGRDTDRLTKKGIARATCESLAENTTDGVIAPLFWIGIGLMLSRSGGTVLTAVFVWAYKASSTLDSMVGYRNLQYENVGRASAKLDDFMAYFPARLTAGLMIISSFLLRFKNLDVRAAFLTCARQHNHHSSPNSGWPEATAAGALGIHMGGEAYYSGVRKETPILGFDLHSPDISDISRMTWLMWLSYVLCALLTAFWPYGMIVLSFLMIMAALLGNMSGLFGGRGNMGGGAFKGFFNNFNRRR